MRSGLAIATILVYPLVHNTLPKHPPKFALDSFDCNVIGKPYRSYVAIGDSLSEGLGDFTFNHQRHENGWTDRLANIMAQEAQNHGYEFHYANLALRGSKLETIMQQQVYRALRLQPDLVTVMAGNNNFLSGASLDELRGIFRTGILELLAAGCDVVVANTINPRHLRVFRPLLASAQRFSDMIAEVAGEFEIPVLDVHGIQSFEELIYWAEDMVHFSGHGHIKIANRAAELLDLSYRYHEIPDHELPAISRGLLETLRWVKRDVVPFFGRKLRGVTSGDGLEPKHQTLTVLKPSERLEMTSAF